VLVESHIHGASSLNSAVSRLQGLFVKESLRGGSDGIKALASLPVRCEHLPKQRHGVAFGPLRFWLVVFQSPRPVLISPPAASGISLRALELQRASGACTHFPFGSTWTPGSVALEKPFLQAK